MSIVNWLRQQIHRALKTQCRSEAAGTPTIIEHCLQQVNVKELGFRWCVEELERQPLTVDLYQLSCQALGGVLRK